jgi:MFS family permease
MKRVTARRRSLSDVSFCVVVGTFLVMFGEGAINPVLPLFGQALGGGVAVVGVLIAASGTSRMIFNFPAGRIADAFGRKPLLVFGPVVALGAAAASAAAQEVWQLVLLRLVTGVGVGCFMTGSIIVLSDIDDEADRLHAIGLYRAAVIIGVLVGPIAGGAVGQGVGYRATFFLQVAVCAAASLWSYVRLPATAARAGGTRAAPRRWHEDVRALLANRDLVLVSLVTFNMFFMLTGARQAIVPLIGEDRLGIDAGGLGVLFAIISLANLLSLWPASRLGRRYGPKPVIVASGVACAISLCVFAAADNNATFLLGGVLMGVGSGLASPTTAAYAAGVAPSDARGSAMGLYQAVGDSGFVVGPLLLGWIAAAAGLSAGLVFNAALALVVSAVFAVAATAGSRAAATRSKPQ